MEAGIDRGEEHLVLLGLELSAIAVVATVDIDAHAVSPNDDEFPEDPPSPMCCGVEAGD
jgi:hypothetical protein